MNEQIQPLPIEDLEASSAAVVGKIIFSLSAFELDLGLFIRCAVGGSNLDLLNPLVDRLSFKQKLDAVVEIIGLMHGPESECLKDFSSWYRKMDRIRTTRNSFVHGRWGVSPGKREVINVAPGMPGPEAKRETRFSVADLSCELKEIEGLVHEFGRLRDRWGM